VTTGNKRRSAFIGEGDVLKTMDGAGGFTAGIQKLLDIFAGSTLRVLESAYITEAERDPLVSLWGKGIRRLADPNMLVHQRRLLIVLATGGKWEAVYHLFPTPMQTVITRCLLSRSVDGRGMQVLTDMHTGFNTAWIREQQAGGNVRQPPSGYQGRALRAAQRAGEDDE